MSSIENFDFGVSLSGGAGKPPAHYRRPAGYEFHKQQVLHSKKKNKNYDRNLTPPLLGLAIGDFLNALTTTCEQITRKFKSKFETSDQMNTELSLFLLTMTSLYLRENLPEGTSDYKDVLDERIANALKMGCDEILTKILTSTLPGSIDKVMSLGMEKSSNPESKKKKTEKSQDLED
jgi:hypothetical protein